ncbi:MAG: endonuclease/exonuclease/phosphatase family protein [Halapricum sp.]
MPRSTNRRTFLKGVGATAATTGLVGTASAYDYRTATRFAQFNIQELETSQVQEKGDETAAAAARVIQEADPDILLINELTNNIQEGESTDTENVRAFIDNYLREPQADHLEGLSFPYTFQPPSNTGVLPDDDYDFNKDGSAGELPGDAFGFGFYPGHYAFAVASQYPIVEDEIRTFQKFLWKDMPGNLMPVDDGSMHINKGEDDIWLTEEEAEVFRLSSKTHVDVPFRVDGEIVHGLMSHPTPPGFDASNNFNGRWNHDENRFWADYVADADYIYDDDGHEGGLDDDMYVLMGDMNAGPMSDRILHPSRSFFFENDDFYTEELPTSPGGRAHGHKYATRIDGDFEGVVEQVDYVLPSPELTYEDSGVMWPAFGRGQRELYEAVQNDGGASDHRMVWADLNIEKGGYDGFDVGQDESDATSADLRALLRSLLRAINASP